MSVTDEIKARIDVIELVSETVKLRRSGKNWTGFCPFHPNSRTPAFVVFPDSGTWRCFGQCNEGGDIFKFVMKKEGWDFAQTLKYLAQRAGVQLEPPSPEKERQEEEYARLRGLLEDAVNFFRHHLLSTPLGKPALEFLQRRGLQQPTIETFGLGYAPDSFNAALDYFTRKGTGLVTERQEGGGVYDRFRHRVMFPIRDMTGRMTGFGARILRPDDIPKFLNSPQTVLFDKGGLLYGLDQARKPIRTQDQVVIVEGYLDVIVLHQAGFTNTVSPMGTALTETQMRMLKKFTRRIVLALDADAAGEKATLRGLEVARQAMDHTEERVFDARGLVKHEARLQADLRVTTLPPGSDPDEVVLKDPEEWKQILAAAQPVVIHVMETLARGRSLDDPKTKSEIAAQVLPLVEEVPSPIERDAYRQRLARLLRVDERTLTAPDRGRPSVRSLGQGNRRAESAPGIRQRQALSSEAQLERGGPIHDLEAHCLKLLLRQPEALYKLDRALQAAGLSRLSIQDFEFADHQALARLLLDSLEQDDHDPQHFIEFHLEGALQDLAKELFKPLGKDEMTQDKFEDDLERTTLRLRHLRIKEGLTQLRHLQEDLQQQGEKSLEAYNELVVAYVQTLGRLQKALDKPMQNE